MPGRIYAAAPLDLPLQRDVTKNIEIREKWGHCSGNNPRRAKDPVELPKIIKSSIQVLLQVFKIHVVHFVRYARPTYRI